MITLNTDAGLVKIEKWEDIEALPNFQSNLNPLDHKLESIIGRYIFKEKIKCGLSNCHAPHNKGYIVKTKEGSKTNIGKDCGKTYFGVDFETLSNKYDRDTTEAENRDKLWNFRFKIEDIQEQIAHLRLSDKGAKWVYDKTRSLLNIGAECPDEVVRRIQSLTKSRTNGLFKPREATDSEIETLEISQNRKITKPHFIDEKIADLVGLEALYPENDLKNLLTLDLEHNINTLNAADIDLLTFEELKYWSKWIGTIDSTIERINYSMEAGKKLLTKSNLETLTNVITKSNDKSTFRTYLKSLY